MLQLISHLRRDDRGAALIEYGLLIGLIAVACVAAVTQFGQEISSALSSYAASLSSI
jgi:pilus assembly protein Flp/PilA